MNIMDPNEKTIKEVIIDNAFRVAIIDDSKTKGIKIEKRFTIDGKQIYGDCGITIIDKKSSYELVESINELIKEL